jgi:HAD superfamily hydrolase (TIGR01509 family)
MRPTVVLFDFDGVLADTENVHVAAWERTFGQMGLDVPADQCARAAEIDDREFLREVFERKKVEAGDLAGWVRRKQELAIAMLREWPPLYPGVPALLRALSETCKLAVVTTTWRANVESVLRPCGLWDHFGWCIGKEDVTNQKPAPDAYLLALERMKVPASKAVAIEDSSTGLEAARAAGIRVVAVGHRRAEGDWCEGAPYVESLEDRSAVMQAIGLL